MGFGWPLQETHCFFPIFFSLCGGGNKKKTNTRGPLPTWIRIYSPLFSYAERIMLLFPPPPRTPPYDLFGSNWSVNGSDAASPFNVSSSFYVFFPMALKKERFFFFFPLAPPFHSSASPPVQSLTLPTSIQIRHFLSGPVYFLFFFLVYSSPSHPTQAPCCYRSQSNSVWRMWQRSQGNGCPLAMAENFPLSGFTLFFPFPLKSATSLFLCKDLPSRWFVFSVYIIDEAHCGFFLLFRSHFLNA